MTLKDAWDYITGPKLTLPKEPMSLEEFEIISEIRNLRNHTHSDNEMWMLGYEKGWNTCFKDLSCRLHDVYDPDIESLDDTLKQFYDEVNNDT